MTAKATHPLPLLRQLLFVMGCLLSLSGAAQATAPATPPDQVIRTATTALQSRIGENLTTYRGDKAAFYTMVDQQVAGNFDTQLIAQIILGAHRKDATPEQVTRFENAFKNMLIRQYADKLLEYYDEVQIDVKPARIDGSGTKANVDTAILRQGKPPITVQFRMRSADGTWKAWDIVAENISLVTAFRDQVDAAVKRSNLTAVIDGLESGALVIDGDQGGSSDSSGSSGSSGT